MKPIMPIGWGLRLFGLGICAIAWNPFDKFRRRLPKPLAEAESKEEKAALTKGLILNCAGEVFLEEGDGLPLGTINLGENVDWLWQRLRSERSALVSGGGRVRVFSVDAMREASHQLYAGVFPWFNQRECEQFRSWLEQLREF